MSDDDLIPEFMGLKRYDPDKHYNLPQWYMPVEDKRKKGSFVGYSGQMKYATSWNHLMPVVLKITQHVYDCDVVEEVTYYDRAHLRTFAMMSPEGKWMTRFNRSPLFEADTLLEATYNAVIDWIKWYNQQKL